VKGKVIIIAIALLAMGCKSQVVDRVIKLTVTETSDYCGGAAPPAELLETLLKEKPFTGKLYVHSTPDRTDDGQTLIINNGSLKQSGFAEGVYFVFLHPKINREELTSDKIDEELISCLEMVSSQHTASFIITKETKSSTIHAHKMCDPCSPPRP
tara:strand:- start:1377 stop:1841 length:465 start_codon:yes stop_codon:yes gene_type:complete